MRKTRGVKRERGIRYAMSSRLSDFKSRLDNINKQGNTMTIFQLPFILPIQHLKVKQQRNGEATS